MESPIPPSQPNNSQSSANQQNVPSSSTGPQIRSRITVVCAECKRLKLKCDRRAPCGSCTKRDTVVRCIYSPAAAEKVDLHSLNNRLIQVEAILQMITNGQQPPAFQSVYPFTSSYPAGTGFSTTTASNAASNNTPLFNTNSTSVSQQPTSQHQHHHHYAAPPSATNDSRLMLSPQDVSTIWLDDLDLGISRPLATATTNATSASNSNTNSTQQIHTHHPHTTSNAGNLGYIKLEPSSIDVDFSYPPSSNNNTNINNSHGFGRSIVIDVDNTSSHIPSRTSTPPPTRRPNGSFYPQYQQQQNHSRAAASGSGSATSSSSSSSAAVAAQAQLLLPALSIYYPVPSISPPGTSPSSSAAFPFHHPAHSHPSPTNQYTNSSTTNHATTAACTSPSSSYSATATTANPSSSNTSINGYIFPPSHTQIQSPSVTLSNPHSNISSTHSQPSSQAPSSKPQVTPALLALLPPVERCRTLLERAGEVLRVRPVPLPLPAGLDLDLDGLDDGLDANMHANADLDRDGMDEPGTWDWGEPGRAGGDEWNEHGEDGEDANGDESAAARRRGKHRDNGRQTRRGSGGQGRVQPPTKMNVNSWKAFESRCIMLLLGSGPSSGPLNLARIKRQREREHERERERERERKEQERKKKAKEAKRARQIYFGGITGLQGSANSASHGQQHHEDAEMEDGSSGMGMGLNKEKDGQPLSSLLFEDPATSGGSEDAGAGDEQSLTFFATMCAVLAIGAFSSSSSSSSSSSTSSSGGPGFTPAGSLHGGSSNPTSSATTDSAAFFYALSQQALSVWDTHISSSPLSGTITSLEGDRDESDAGKERGDEREKERMQYVLACIVGVGYLQLVSSIPATGASAGRSGEDTRAEEGAVAHDLVGKMVSAACVIGLGRESSSASSSSSYFGTRKSRTGAGDKRGSIGVSGNTTGLGLGRRKREKDGVEAEREKAKEMEEREQERAKEEWRRMILCEVMFLDLFTSDMLGLQPHISSTMYASMNLPACASATSSSDSGTAGHRHRSYGHSNDGDVDDDEDSIEYSNQHRRPFCNDNQNPNDSDVDAGVDGHSYLGARHRLTQIAQMIKTRITNPDCCCGYTLDQATSLEDDIRRWQSGLPIALKLPVSALGISDHDVPPNTSILFDKEKDNMIYKMQSCELSIMANMLLVKVYTPFLRNASTSAVAARSPSPSTVPGAPSPTGTSAAYQTTMYAGQAIVRAAKILQDVRAKTPGGADGPSSISIPNLNSISSSSVSTSPAMVDVLPAMFDFYSLEKVVFDAVVICAHAGLVGGPGNSKASSLSALAFTVDGGKAVMEDVGVGLNILSDMCAGPGRGVGEAQKRVMEVLYRRLSLNQDGLGGLHSLKRKHDQIELSSSFGDVSNGYSTIANGVVSGGNGETTLSEFDFGHNHNGHQTSNSQHQQPQNSSLAISLPGTSSATASRSSVPPNSAHAIALANFPQDRMQRSDQQKKDLVSSVAATRLTAAARNSEKDHGQEKEKEKKHAKKSHPVVGIRVRPGKEAHLSSSSRSRGQSLSGPLMTSIPRPLPSSNGPSAEAVLAFQQKQKMQVMGNVEDAQRSRSSSFAGQLQQQQPEQQHRRRLGSDGDYSLPFGQPSDEAMQRKAFGMHEHGPVRQQKQQQQQQQQLSPTQIPFTPRIVDQTHTMYDQTPAQAPFDNGPAPSSADCMTYNNTVSSPFSNSGGPPSSSGSPFASTSVASSGHPSTPTFNAHHPTPPVFGPQQPLPPASGSPTAYFHASNAFNESYNNSPSTSHVPGHHQHGQSISIVEMGMDQSMVSVSESPIYDKPQQQQESMYDAKPPPMGGNHSTQHMHMLQQQQRPQQHHQHHLAIGPTSRSYEEDMDITGQNQNQQISMGMAVSAAWPGAVAGAQQHQQQSQNVETPQAFWGNEPDYRFYA